MFYSDRHSVREGRRIALRITQRLMVGLGLGLGGLAMMVGGATPPARAQDTAAATATAGAAAATSPLVAYTIVNNLAIPDPLTDEPGDPARGRAVAVDREGGNCLACHHMPIPEEEFHGETGPSLWGVAQRLTPAELRLRLVDAKAVNPDTMMPGFYVVEGLRRVPKAFEGKPILTAQQIEDVIALLETFTEDDSH